MDAIKKGDLKFVEKFIANDPNWLSRSLRNCQSTRHFFHMIQKWFS